MGQLHTVLVANRGEIAVRVIRTLRRMGIRSVAVYSDADRDSRHVAEADTAVHIGPKEAEHSYLSVPRVVGAARDAGAQAVHPGYGFLSENPAFARACAEAGIVFLGPGAEAIESMGDKIRAKRTVRAAGWPTALVTNTLRSLTEQALESIGREHFTVTVCGDEVPHGKPAPDPYLRAAELLGVAPQQCLAIEDSPTGAIAAERAGAAVLVVPCEVPVPAGPQRVHRASLTGLTAADVRAGYAQARSKRAA